MGFSLLLLWVWMKSPCCSAIRTGHSPVNLSQWAIHDFLYAMSNCYKHILSNYHSQSHLQMHIQSQIIWITVFHWSISKHLRQYLDTFEWWKALPLGNVLDLFSLCILRCVLLTMALRVKSHSYYSLHLDSKEMLRWERGQRGFIPYEYPETAVLPLIKGM